MPDGRMNAAYQVMRPNTHRGPIAVVAAEALAEADPCTMVVAHAGWRITITPSSLWITGNSTIYRMAR